MSTYTDTAGETLIAKNVCYRKSDGKLYKASAATASKMPAIALASASIATNASGAFFSRGKVNVASHSLGSSGDLLYVSAMTIGLITAAIPTSSTNQVQIVGQIVDANYIDFSPNFILIEIA